MGSVFLNSVVWDLMLSAVLPKLIGFLVSHTENDYQKKRVAYIVCFAVALLSTAATGAFSPVLNAFEAGVSLAAIVNAVGVFVGILIAKWTLITGLTSQIYDKVYHAEKKLKEEKQVEAVNHLKSHNPPSVSDALADAASKMQGFGMSSTPKPTPLIPIPQQPRFESTPFDAQIEVADEMDEAPELDERWTNTNDGAGSSTSHHQV